jgi:hypothetical protein
MGYPRQREGRPRGLSLAHPHVHRSRCGIPVRAGRRGGERGAQDRRHVAGVELGHHGEECSFDAIVKKYNVKDAAISRLALIVRGADTPRRDLTPQSPGLEAIAEGFKRLAAAQGYDDHETIRRERHLYDALYLYCGGDPNKLQRD